MLSRGPGPFFEHFHEPLLLLDHDFTIECANAAARHLLGLPEDGRRRPLRGFVAEDTLPSFDRGVEALSHQLTGRMELCLHLGGQELVYMEVSASRVTVGGRTVIQAALRERSEALDRSDGGGASLLRDELTGLASRMLLRDRLHTAINRQKRRGRGYTLLLVDLDGFDAINAEHGREVGDRVLTLMARRLESCVRPDDTVARFFGDEFAVLLADVDDAERVTPVVERIEKALERTIEMDGAELSLTASIGVLTSDSSSGEDLDRLLADVDLAMLRARQRGGGRAQFFEPGLRGSSDGLSVEAELELAVERREFVIHYQPVVDLRTGRIRELEALLRWRHPRRGLLFPSDFLSRAEASGVIVPIGHFVVEAVCRQLADWRTQPALRALPISINLSNRQFADPEIRSRIEQELLSGRIEADRLRIEITETALIEAPARSALARLRELGISVSLDDFGTGYSSLSYLQTLQIDVLKIDRSFIRRLGRSDEALRIVKTIVDLAHSLQIEVTAEGVESRGQLETLRSLDTDAGQGILFAQPRDVGRVEQLMLAGPVW